jgi:membrane protease YdiL (CAAX protease family)
MRLVTPVAVTPCQPMYAEWAAQRVTLGAYPASAQRGTQVGRCCGCAATAVLPSVAGMTNIESTQISSSTSTQRHGVRSIVGAHPLISFFLFTLVLSWWPWPLYAAGIVPLPIASFGPFLAAIAVLGITGGRSAIHALIRSMLRWRIPGRWWVLMIATPVLITTTALALNLLLGAQPPSAAQFGAWSGVPIAFAVALLVPGFGGAWEEPGWRGYALPRLVEPYGWKRAGLLLGAVTSVWHLPLMLTGLISWWDLLLVVSSNVVIAWLFLSSGRSVLLVMVLHATNNAFSGSYVSQLFTGADASRQAAITALVWAVTAIVLLTTRGPRS